MSNNTIYVLVDDDRLNNLISGTIIKRVLKDPVVKDFTDPVPGLDYLKQIATTETPKIILLLDINMPVMTGWDVLDELEKLDTSVKNRIKVFMLSSSVYQKDKTRANKYSLVIDYIEKPLNTEKFEAVCSKADYLEMT